MRWISVLILTFFSMMVSAASVEAVNPSDASAEVQSTVQAKESEIPIVLASKKEAVAHENPVGRGLWVLAILGILCAGGYVFVKKYRPKSVREHAQIKVLTQHYLGPKKTLTMVRVAGETLLLGVTDHNINLIKNLSLLDEELPNEVQPRFENAMKVMDKKETGNEDEDFAISGIKDIVSKKLKDMRTFG